MHAFFFHYNKPATAAAGKPQMTVHYRGRCHVVDHVVCTVPVSSRSRRGQPRVVMAGRGVVHVRDATAFIVSR